ncbi:conserved hypothetical protein [Neospora caninum Liverpool]|uniref:Zinc finger domain, LSD1 subclass domain-containing protein n=1 Tax=Neospora caninum (strain Liverpool) TaxID=572307 RepID=F0VDS0_NEOCL|nr:conserved hypothetical protein [Neospora caninum Liverpool]CBZ51863.1 conserved hypothetical protein [Neospora caninum Liverpool]|eukprot:XP_003881896.1 conserved hypothetical protein [Neospora caninum Liverpool]
MADSSEGAADGRAETRPSSGPETEAPVGHRTPSRASAFTALVATLSHTRDSEGDEPASEASSSATPPESILLGSVQADGQSGEAQSDLVPAGSATSQELAVDAGSHEDGASEARGAVLRERTERGPVEGCTNAAGETEGQASRRGRSAATIPANADGESGDSTCRRKFRGERAGPDAYVGNDCFFLELPDGAVSCVAGLENLPASVEAVNGPNPGDAQQGPFLARLQCHNCLQLLEFDSRAQFVQCSSCLTLNAVQSQASNGLRGGRAMIVICGRCSTRNISCLGSLYVECWQCRTVCQVDYPAAGSGLLGPSGAERSRTGETGVSSEGSRLHRRLLSRRSFPRPRFRWLTSRRQGDSEAAALPGGARRRMRALGVQAQWLSTGDSRKLAARKGRGARNREMSPLGPATAESVQREAVNGIPRACVQPVHRGGKEDRRPSGDRSVHRRYQGTAAEAEVAIRWAAYLQREKRLQNEGEPSGLLQAAEAQCGEVFCPRAGQDDSTRHRLSWILRAPHLQRSAPAADLTRHTGVLT